MQGSTLRRFLAFSCSSLLLASCAQHSTTSPYSYSGYSPSTDYAARIPQTIDTKGEKVVVVDPRAHVWGAYNPDGSLVRAGLATAGGDWCADTGRSCRTGVGSFRIYSLGDGECISKIYPLPEGGGLMPYCMFFNNGEALHGSPEGTVIEDNVSHGCVRMHIPDAEWLRYNFVEIGTRVIVRSY